MRNAAFASANFPPAVRPPEFAHSSVSPSSSETRRNKVPPSSNCTLARNPIAPFTTTPPSRAENGGTSVQPPAKSSRMGALA